MRPVAFQSNLSMNAWLVLLCNTSHAFMGIELKTQFISSHAFVGIELKTMKLKQHHFAQRASTAD
eukprot:2287556-Lingulodinium_polyedra.AAC.1